MVTPEQHLHLSVQTALRGWLRMNPEKLRVALAEEPSILTSQVPEIDPDGVYVTMTRRKEAADG